MCICTGSGFCFSGVHVGVKLRASVLPSSTSQATLVPSASKNQNGALGPSLWQPDGDSFFCSNSVGQGHIPFQRILAELLKIPGIDALSLSPDFLLGPLTLLDRLKLVTMRSFETEHLAGKQRKEYSNNVKNRKLQDQNKDTCLQMATQLIYFIRCFRTNTGYRDFQAGFPPAVNKDRVFRNSGH